MQRNSNRFLPLFITLIVIVLIIVAIVSIGRAIFGGGGSETPAEGEADKGRTALLDSDSSNSVSLTVRGPIVADEDFKSYRITVSPSNRNMTAFTGYLDEEDRAKNLKNNTEAYEQFTHALDKANMMKGTEPSGTEEDDLRGICASGYVYEYAVLVEDEPVKHLWTSTCSGSKGTLDASTDQLNALFLAQIPDSRDMIPFRSSPLRLRF